MFKKGKSGNPRGRPRVVGDLRDLCRKFGAEGVKLLAQIARDEDQPGRARVEAIKELFVRGYGRVVSAADMVVLMSSQAKNDDGGEVSLVIGFGKNGEPATLDLDSYAKRAAEAKVVPSAPVPGPKQIEDLRPTVLQSKLSTNEAAFDRNPGAQQTAPGCPGPAFRRRRTD